MKPFFFVIILFMTICYQNVFGSMLWWWSLFCAAKWLKWRTKVFTYGSMLFIWFSFFALWWWWRKEWKELICWCRIQVCQVHLMKMEIVQKNMQPAYQHGDIPIPLNHTLDFERFHLFTFSFTQWSGNCRDKYKALL